MNDSGPGGWNIECRQHGLLPATSTREAAAELVANHWRNVHPPTEQVIIQGVDWIYYPALMRCDTCSIPLQPPAWEHAVIKGPLGMEFTDLDGRWWLCEPCHDLFVQGKIGAWVRHYMRVSETLTSYPPNRLIEMRLRADLARRFGTLLRELDNGERHGW